MAGTTKNISFRFWKNEYSQQIVTLRNQIEKEISGLQTSVEEFEDQYGHPGWNPEKNLELAFIDDTLVGMFDVWIDSYADGPRATVSIYVHKLYRRKGIATLLLKRGLNRIPDNINRIDIGVPSKAEALKKYVTNLNMQVLSSTAVMRLEVKTTYPKPKAPGDLSLLAYNKGINTHEEFRVLHNDTFTVVPNWRPITREAMDYYVNSDWFDPGKLLFVSEKSSNKLLGWIWYSEELNPDSKVYFIESFGVAKSHQRKGIGTYLLQNIIYEAMKEKVNLIELNVEHDNKVALGMYERMGFYTIRYTEWYSGKRTTLINQLTD